MEKIREEIDRIDDAIIALLSERFRKVAELKDKKTSLRDPKRENEILSKIQSEYIREIYRQIFKTSLKMLADQGFIEKS